MYNTLVIPVSGKNIFSKYVLFTKSVYKWLKKCCFLHTEVKLSVPVIWSLDITFCKVSISFQNFLNGTSVYCKLYENNSSCSSNKITYAHSTHRHQWERQPQVRRLRSIYPIVFLLHLCSRILFATTRILASGLFDHQLGSVSRGWFGCIFQILGITMCLKQRKQKQWVFSAVRSV